MTPDLNRNFDEVMKTLNINWPRLVPSIGGVLYEEFDGDHDRLKDFLSFLVESMKAERRPQGDAPGAAAKEGSPIEGGGCPPAAADDDCQAGAIAPDGRG